MREFKSLLKELVGEIVWGVHYDLSNLWLRICYGQKYYIIQVCKLLEICDDDSQLSVKELLLICNQYSSCLKINVIGEIRLVDSINDNIGIFNIKGGFGDKDLFDRIFYDNLRLIDGDMPKLLMEIVMTARCMGTTKISEIFENILTSNPLDVDNEWIKNTYLFKIGRLLYNFAIGLTEESVWQGDTPVGGIVFIVGETYYGFNYYNQTAIGKFLIDSSEFIMNKNDCCFKVSR